MGESIWYVKFSMKPGFEYHTLATKVKASCLDDAIDNAIKYLCISKNDYLSVESCLYIKR